MQPNEDELRSVLSRVAPAAPESIDDQPRDADEVHDRLVEAEDQAPGTVRKAIHPLGEDLFIFPNGPLIPVSDDEQRKRIQQTAQERWAVTNGELTVLRDLDGLVAAVSAAEASGRPIRFVGSARSLSRAPEPEAGAPLGVFADFSSQLPVETQTLRDGIEPTSLYRAESGRVVANVLIDLVQSGRALQDMGSGDFQGLVGAVSTSTHGSGVKYPALPALVKSMDVVSIEPPASPQGTSTVVKRRIEPQGGITDPEKFELLHAHDGLQLVQNDEIFDSYRVSLGCLGAIYSIVLEVVPSFYLHETRTLEPWSKVKREMATDLNRIDYYEILVSPFASLQADGTQDFTCLVTRRTRVENPANQKVSGGRPIGMKLAQTWAGRLAAGIELASTLRNPSVRAPKMVHTGLSATQVESYTDEWYKILLLRLDVNADSAELGIPMALTVGGAIDPSNAISATETILALAGRNQASMQSRLAGHSHPFESAFDALEKAWREVPLHTSPISLRFVREDTAALSMQYGKPTCMIEMPMPGNDSYQERLINHPDWLEKKEHRYLKLYKAYVDGRTQLFSQVESALASMNVRPHWGQTNFMTWDKVQATYPRAGSWKSIYDRANYAGTFDGPLTDQLGISQRQTRSSGVHPTSTATEAVRGAV